MKALQHFENIGMKMDKKKTESFSIQKKTFLSTASTIPMLIRLLAKQGGFFIALYIAFS